MNQTMPISNELSRVLVCPVCHTAITELRGGQELECLSCKRRFPIVDGFPVMLPVQMRQPSGGKQAEIDRDYHLGERKKSDNEQYLSPLLAPLEIKNNSSFLDVGCGTGYVNNYLASRNSLKDNLGFDIDLDVLRLGRELETSPGKITWFCASGLSIP